MDYSYVYELRNPITGDRYIGSTQYKKKRKKQHFYALKKGIHCNKILTNVYKKYGNILEFNILHKSATRGWAYLEEQWYLSNKPCKYNIAKLVRIPSITDDSIKKISLKMSTYRNNQFKPFKINGEKYISLKQAENAIGVAWSTIRGRLLSNTFPDYKYLNEQEKQIYVETLKHKENNGENIIQQKLRERSCYNLKLKPFMINNNKYISSGKASKKLKIHRSTISSRLNSDDYPEYQYLDHAEAEKFIQEYTQGKAKHEIFF